MSDPYEEQLNNLADIRQARNQAESLRDQLQAELQLLEENDAIIPDQIKLSEKFHMGKDALRKAIAAANCAIDSIDQALRDLERASDD